MTKDEENIVHRLIEWSEQSKKTGYVTYCEVFEKAKEIGDYLIQGSNAVARFMDVDKAQVRIKFADELKNISLCDYGVIIQIGMTELIYNNPNYCIVKYHRQNDIADGIELKFFGQKPDLKIPLITQEHLDVEFLHKLNKNQEKVYYPEYILPNISK